MQNMKMEKNVSCASMYQYVVIIYMIYNCQVFLFEKCGQKLDQNIMTPRPLVEKCRAIP